MSFATVSIPDASIPEPLAAALGSEIAQRREATGLRRGAVCVERRGFVRFERAYVLAAVPWGESFGAWALPQGAQPGALRGARVWLDAEGLNLGLGSEVPGGPLDASRCWRQTRLPFREDPYARAWNERVIALSTALGEVPDWAIEQVSRLRPYQQWPLLGLVNRGGRQAADLCRANLAVAHLVATRCAPEAAPRLLALRQRDILEQLGLPSSRSAVRVLRRVVDGAVDGPTLDLVFLWLKDDRARRPLAQAPHIGPALRLFREPGGPAWMTPLALQDALGVRDEGSLHALAEAAQLVAALKTRGFEPPGRLQRLADLDAWLETLRERHRKIAATAGNQPFRRPPFPGVKGQIEPILSTHELLEEGETMSHCVFDYSDLALSGELAFYRVLKPERATLALERPPGRRSWQIWSLKCRANREPRLESHAAVARWLRAHRRRLRRPADTRQCELWPGEESTGREG